MCKKRKKNIYCSEVYFIAPKEHDKMEEIGALQILEQFDSCLQINANELLLGKVSRCIHLQSEPQPSSGFSVVLPRNCSYYSHVFCLWFSFLYKWFGGDNLFFCGWGHKFVDTDTIFASVHHHSKFKMKQ